ncbi:MAG: ABC transporter ATP-binding protein [Deltaproteobacteria bacterium]|nr:ABC transporter ATP-binding protein [Deltaproteobacteria bacterium]
MSHKVLKIENLSHSYTEKSTLNKLSFNISRGDFFIIAGPNGSGKTTLLKLLAGIEKIQRGGVRIFGKNLSKYSKRELAQKVAYVPQYIPSEFPFTVFETVLQGRTPHSGILGINSEKDIGITKKAMSFTGVDRHHKKNVGKLSGGEKQRVQIARAICQEPSIIFLDEPTASLDIAHQIKIMDLMKELTKKGVTVVMVSHDINLASMYADTILLLKNGAIVTMGDADSVLKREILEKTYECKILVDINPVNKRPRINPQSMI